MFYHKKKGFFYYTKMFVYSAVAVVAVYYIWQNGINNSFDADKILRQSVLQNKTFSAEVKEIEESGVKAYLLEEHSNPIVSMNFEFANSGYAHDEVGKFGLAKMSVSLITEGAGEYDDKELYDILEENGIRLWFSAGRDEIFGAIATPKANLKTAQYLFRQIIFAPRLPEDILEIKKAQMLKSLKQQKETPDGELSLAFTEQIFAGHPYARNPLGKKEDIINITSADIRDYLQKSFAKQNLTVGISGDITAEEAASLLKDVFGQLPDETKQKPLEKFDYSSNGSEFKLTREIPQVIAAFASKGLTRSDKDFYALYMANYVFGGSGLTSRLNKILREENGLTYGIYTTFSDSSACALIRGGFSASSNDYERAKNLLIAEWQKMAKEGISEDELAETKKALLDSYNLRFADIGGVSSMLVAMQHHNLGIDFLQKRNDYIRNITLDEVNKAAALYFGTLPNFVTIGPEGENNNVRTRK